MDPILYRWDDTSAPTLDGTAGSAISLLQACLVDGYGSKAAAGWTKPYENAGDTIAVFRNDTVSGTGTFYQIDYDSQAAVSTFNLTGYETMTDEVTGLNNFSTYQHYALCAPASTTTAYSWVVIADNRTCYAFFPYLTAVSTILTTSRTDDALFFGDVIPFDPTDSYACCVSGLSGQGIGLGVTSAGTVSAASSAANISMPRTPEGTYGPKGYRAIRGGGPGADATGTGRLGPDWTTGDPILYTRPHLGGVATYSIRGYIPGFYYPCHSATSDWGQYTEITVDGIPMFVIVYVELSNVVSNIFISLTDWWA